MKTILPSHYILFIDNILSFFSRSVIIVSIVLLFANFILFYYFNITPLQMFVALTLLVVMTLILYNLEYGIYLLIIFSFFGCWLQIDLSPFIGLGLWIHDLLIIFLCLAWVVQQYTNRQIFKFGHVGVDFMCIILILFIPLVIGLLREHLVTTILRDSRPFIYYLLPLIVATVINSRRKWLRFGSIIITISVVAVVMYLFMYTLRIRFPAVIGLMANIEVTTGEIVRSYGIASSWYYFPLAIFMMISLFHTKKGNFMKLMILVCIVLFFTAIFTLAIRSLFFSTVVGATAAILFNARTPKSYIKRFTITSSIVALVSVLAYGTISSSELVYNPYVERYLSVVDPNISSPVNLSNLEYRKNAIYWGIKMARDYGVLGKGYGDKIRLEKKNVGASRHSSIGFQNHSSIAWALARLGPLLCLLFVVCIIKLVFDIHYRLKFLTDSHVSNMLCGYFAFFISLIFMAPATNVFFRGDFYTILVLIILGLIISSINFINE